MTELVSKAILSGLGFMSLTKEAIQETVADLVNQSKLSEAEGRKVVKAFARRSARAQKKLEKRVDAAVHKVLQNLDLTAVEARLQGKKKSPRRKVKKSGKRASGRASGAKKRK
jgi:polyhydroxyalkanoate synthesis regulator phasin